MSELVNGKRFAVALLPGHGLVFHAAAEGELIHSVALVGEGVDAEDGLEHVHHRRHFFPRGAVGCGVALRVEVVAERERDGGAAAGRVVGVGQRVLVVVGHAEARQVR